MRSFVVALSLLTGVAQAAPHGGRHAEAVRHFERAQGFYEQSRYQDALQQLEQGYALEPRPEFLIAIAQALRALGRLDDAIDRLDRYLAVAQRGPLADRVAAFARELRQEAAHAAKSAPPPRESSADREKRESETTAPPAPERPDALPTPSASAPPPTAPTSSAPSPAASTPAASTQAAPRPDIATTPTLVASAPASPPRRRSHTTSIVVGIVAGTAAVVALGLGLGLGLDQAQPPHTALGTLWFK